MGAPGIYVGCFLDLPTESLKDATHFSTENKEMSHKNETYTARPYCAYFTDQLPGIVATGIPILHSTEASTAGQTGHIGWRSE